MNYTQDSKHENTHEIKSAPAGMAGRYSAKRTLHHKDFFCTAPKATSVSLVGDFNEWKPEANPMRKMPDGRWMIGMELHHGHHQYVFWVDGKPQLDPAASGIARNERNERVSLIAVS
jgi:1,4-alpha-glucan branching enzyme